LPAFIYLSVDILLRINLLEKHRRNGKKQPKLISRDRPKTANCTPWMCLENRGRFTFYGRCDRDQAAWKVLPD
jgi:hypothetical protein